MSKKKCFVIIPCLLLLLCSILVIPFFTNSNSVYADGSNVEIIEPWNPNPDNVVDENEPGYFYLSNIYNPLVTGWVGSAESFYVGTFKFGICFSSDGDGNTRFVIGNNPLDKTNPIEVINVNSGINANNFSTIVDYNVHDMRKDAFGTVDAWKCGRVLSLSGQSTFNYNGFYKEISIEDISSNPYFYFALCYGGKGARCAIHFVNLNDNVFNGNIAYYTVSNFSNNSDVNIDTYFSKHYTLSNLNIWCYRFYCYNGCYLEFFMPSFLVCDSDPNYHYTNNNFSTSSDNYNLGYSEGYTSGSNYGYTSGFNAGKTSGYDNGYNVGLSAGYDNGYNNGVNDSNVYTFNNLFGAVIDAPIKAFSGLFNFNLLGVNLLGFITGLFTLAILIFIIKLMLGGK